jgi:hypothetical protein
MNSKMEAQMKELVQAIGELASARQQLARKAEQQYALEGEAIFQSQCRDPKQIERLLDDMLDFCFNEQMLLWYKKLCRYYFEIDPAATVSCVNAYRDIWDDIRS